MKKALKWIRDYWYVPLFVLAVVLGWVIFRKRGTPIAQTQAELAAIQAGRRIRELEAEAGAEAAKQAAYKDYMDKRAKLSVKQQAQAERLKDDPVALSKFLVRAGGSS